MLKILSYCVPSCVRHRMVIYVQRIITLLERFLTKPKE